MDDDDGVIDTVKNHCIKKEYQFLYRYNAKDCDDIVEEENPDIVVSDQNMGGEGFNGLDACKMIREKFKELPIILFTGASFLERETNLIKDLGNIRIIHKDFRELFDTLERSKNGHE